MSYFVIYALLVAVIGRGADANRGLLQKPGNDSCVAYDNRCSFYAENCCGNLICTMQTACTSTALGTMQKCIPLCKRRATTPVRNVTIDGFLAWEAGKRTAPAVLLLQEWWGINDAMKQWAEHLTLQGYRTLLPDFYQGKVALNVSEALHLSSGLNWTVAIKQMQSAVEYLLRTGSPKVAATGFCQGGGLAMCAAQWANISATAVFYGLPNMTYCQPDKIKVPILYQSGANDTSFPPERVNATIQMIKAAGNAPYVQWYLYPNTQHAYMNGMTPAGRALIAARPAPEASVTQSFARYTAFLAKYLRQ